MNAIGTIIPGQLYSVFGKPLPYKNEVTRDHGDKRSIGHSLVYTCTAKDRCMSVPVLK